MNDESGQTAPAEQETQSWQCDRRAFLAAAGTGGALGIAGCLGGDSTNSGGGQNDVTVREFEPILDGAWPVYQANLGNSGSGTGGGPIDGVEASPVNSLAGLAAAPAFVDGTLYVNDGRVRAIDASSGEARWQWNEIQTVENAVGTPAVVDGSVFFGSDDGTFYALDASSGEEQWSVELGTAITSSPAVHDGTVYVGGHNGTLYAIDASTGDGDWSVSITTTDGQLAGVQTPAVVDGTVYVTGYSSVSADEGTVTAVTAADGAQEWSLSTDDVVRDAPVVAGDLLVIPLSMAIVGLDRRSGDEQWRFTEPTTGPLTSPAVTDDMAYVTNPEARLFAVNLMTGEQEWQAEGEGEGGSVAIADDVVYLCSGDDAGYVYGYDAANGDTLWENMQDDTYDDGYFPGLCVADGTLYTGSGVLYAFEEA